jgi:hypothetical protein
MAYLDVALLQCPEVKEVCEVVCGSASNRAPFRCMKDALQLLKEPLLVLVHSRDLDALHIDSNQPRIGRSQHSPRTGMRHIEVPTTHQLELLRWHTTQVEIRFVHAAS